MQEDFPLMTIMQHLDILIHILWMKGMHLSLCYYIYSLSPVI